MTAHIVSVSMDNLKKRRIVAITGVVIAFLGLTSFLWGMLKHDSVFQMMGFFSIIIAYVFTLIVKRMRESDEAEKKLKQKEEKP